jgi:acyl-CoA synthetase (AMP-forming)/AMP-acid ligase II
MLTHGNIFANVVQTDAWTNPATSSRGDERYLLVIPYFHIYAFTVGMMTGTVGRRAADHPSEVRRRAGAQRDARLPADLLPGVPTCSSRCSITRARASSASSTSGVQQRRRAVPVEVIEEFERRSAGR